MLRMIIGEVITEKVFYRSVQNRKIPLQCLINIHLIDNGVKLSTRLGVFRTCCQDAGRVMEW